MTDQERYNKAMHAMQTGVALELSRGSDSASPKHLRVGVNSALCDQSALARLLVEKGIMTWDEYGKSVADEAEREVQRYRERLNLPDNVELA